MLKFGRRRPLAGDVPQPSHESKSWFGPEVGAQVDKLWSEGAWMPQEALGIENLRSPRFTPDFSVVFDDGAIDDKY